MPRVALFTTCLVDLVRPQVGAATVRLLERLGVEVEVPGGQTCCGQPAWNAGDRTAARRFVAGWLQVFADAEAVVAPSGSCVAMVRHQFARALEPGEVPSVIGRTHELSEYLVDILGVVDLGARWAGRAVYHPACHGLRGLGIADQPLRLLDRVEGLTVRRLPSDCCGFGGLFSVRYPEVAVALADRRTDLIEDADLLISGDAGCLLHLAGRFEREGVAIEVRHLAEVLAG